jgi:hypothetical protein
MTESVFKRRSKPKKAASPIDGDTIFQLVKKISTLEMDLHAQKVNHSKFVKKMQYLENRVASNENKINFINSTIATMKQTVTKLAGIFR